MRFKRFITVSSIVLFLLACCGCRPEQTAAESAEPIVSTAGSAQSTASQDGARAEIATDGPSAAIRYTNDEIQLRIAALICSGRTGGLSIRATHIYEGSNGEITGNLFRRGHSNDVQF